MPHIPWRILSLAACAAALAGCAALQDAPRLAYQCPRGLDFEARLYQDMALLEGLRGHAVLERVPVPTESDSAPDSQETPLQYANPTVRATFALGVTGRLARLDYTGIPEPIYCQRPPAAAPIPVQATPRPGPRPPPAVTPDPPPRTNIRAGEGGGGPD